MEKILHFCIMLSVCLWFVLSLSRFTGNMMYDPSICLCDTTIEGSVCTNKGMAIYVSTGERPGTFYPVSHTQWAFSESSNSKYLGISTTDTPNISGKYSGVFTAPKTTSYYFYLIVSHAVSNSVCYFDLYECPAFMEIDFSYSDTGSDAGGTCYTTPLSGTKCADSTKETSYAQLVRKFYLVSGNQYPLFAGMRHISAIPQSAAPWLKLTYNTLTSSTKNRVGKEAVAGLTGYDSCPVSSSTTSSSVSDSSSSDSSVSSDSTGNSSVSTSSSASNKYTTSADDGSSGNISTVVTSSKKVNSVVIGGVSAGAFVVLAVCAVSIWAFVRRMKKNGKTFSSDPVGRSKNGNGSSRPGSGRSSRSRSAHGSRPDSGRSSRSRSAHGSRPGSGRSSRSRSAHGSRPDSRRSTRSRSSYGSRPGSSRSSRSRSVHGGSVGSGRSSRASSVSRSRESSLRIGGLPPSQYMIRMNN